MSKTQAIVVFLSCAAAASAERFVCHLHWAKAQPLGASDSVALLPRDGNVPYERLRVTNPHGRPLALTLLALDDPKLRFRTYALSGFLRCDGVEGKGYIEMDSEFPGGEHVLARTLDGSGPMGAIEGTSDWRPFVLPGSWAGEAPPRKLVLRLALPGRGTVVLGPTRLLDYEPGDGPLNNARPWWLRRRWLVAGGALIGSLACLAVLLAWLAAQRRLIRRGGA